MFEKEISNYAFNITKRYTGDKVPLTSLMTDVELPENFRKFAEAEVNEIIDKEELGRSRTGKFDFSRQEIKGLLKEIRHVLKNSFEFTREEFLELADRASKFIFNYVIRPRWTLEKFLFKGENEVTKEDIEKASRFLADYPYYSRGILEYLEIQKKGALDIKTWEQLHAGIDEHLLGTTPSKAVNLVSGIFDLFAFSTVTDKVPTDALILFFRDKSSPEIVDRLEFSKELKNIQFLDNTTLSLILEATSKEVDQKIAVLKTPEEPPKEFRTFERQTMTNPLKPPQPGPIGPKAEPVTREETPPPVVTEPARGETVRMDRQLSETIEPTPEVPKSTTPSIRTIMSEKLEDRIVKKIFHGSRSGYQVAVHKLDESPSWDKASKILEGIFIDNDVDPFSKYAVAFTDVVSAKFRPVRGSRTKF